MKYFLLDIWKYFHQVGFNWTEVEHWICQSREKIKRIKKKCKEKERGREKKRRKVWTENQSK